MPQLGIPTGILSSGVLLLAFLLFLAVPLGAQEKPVQEQKSISTAPIANVPIVLPPVLTEVQKLTVQNLLQKIELAQLRAQQAQRDFDDARGEIGKLIQSLQIDGYTLDLQTLAYVKKVPEKKEPPKEKEPTP